MFTSFAGALFIVTQAFFVSVAAHTTAIAGVSPLCSASDCCLFLSQPRFTRSGAIKYLYTLTLGFYFVSSTSLDVSCLPCFLHTAFMADEAFG